MITLRPYQETARDQALESFRYLAGQLRALAKPEDRAAAIAHNGGVLLKAPTGAGKTLIAGSVAEKLSIDPGLSLVWFWFAPFKGLVGQTESSLREKFPDLRLRDLRADRQPVGTESGDTWVATWQSVAARDAEARKIRADSETAPSIDNLIARLRDAGFKIGVIVDEAHHGFGHATQALEFFTQVLRPEFTLLVTATPDDADAEAFKKAAGFSQLRPISISRQEAVAAGLVKPGVRSVAFIAEQADQKSIVDFEGTALAQGTATHRQIKATLQAAGINLVPLMLVQVDSTKDSEKRVRERLIALGFADGQIATHTANEPDANLLSLAVNEEKEVLIFKMAVALGFDAPRAFTLVSMRGIVDDDFGTQIVGRILRVHPRCQGRSLPPLLQNAYVFLADCESQAGLTTAAQKINQIKTEFGKVSQFALVVSVGGQNQLQVVKDGQTLLLSPEQAQTLTTGLLETMPAVGSTHINWLELLEGTTGQRAGVSTERIANGARGTGSPAAVTLGTKTYPLRAGMPRQFLTQRTRAVTEGLTRSIAQLIRFDNDALLSGIREEVAVIRREQDVFALAEDSVERIRATLDLAQAEMKAQRMLLEFGVIDPRDLHAELMLRLREEYRRSGRAIAGDDEALESALALILVQHPKLLRAAERTALARCAESLPSGTLPENIYADAELPNSRHNLYGVHPPGMNSWEQAFAELLDRDPDGHVLWWHRNESHKPWSVATTLPNGQQFFPDFLVGIRGRAKPDNVLLVDPKRAINDDLNAKVKTVVEHQTYGRTVILFLEDNKRWMTVRYDEATDKNELDSVFRLSAMVDF
ncbi:MAG: DEAD/DEAH box helicase family protein [Opitutaceae bacterium]|nr:DEAD/DEAH box helicase family protein [Opitutaceae bacterium]